jgi:ubiquinone/menaquinone biosynthesis C-methylase UbiE
MRRDGQRSAQARLGRFTAFKYRCGCGAVDFLIREKSTAHCQRCDAGLPLSRSGVIDFLQRKTPQNAYFDGIYEAGHQHKINEVHESSVRNFHNSTEISQTYLELCGFDLGSRIEDLCVLDVACGSGWVTAGLLQHPALRNCTFHALDVSPQGLEMLAQFEQTLDPSHRLEMSVQDAQAMRFEDGIFNVIIGSSVLHHFDDVQGFLADCRRILRPGGVATFGEPFAVGYALGAAALRIAQEQIGTTYREIDDLYQDIGYRIRNASNLEALIDKHLFFQASFLLMGQAAGFRSVDFVPLTGREFYRDSFIRELLEERGVSDDRLAARAADVYRTIFGLFDADSFVHSGAAFIQVVLRT